MRKRHLQLTAILLALLAAMITYSQVEAAEVITRDHWDKRIVTEIDLIRLVDNFIVYFDTSASANRSLEGTSLSKIRATKAFLQFRNEWLPNLGYNAGLYVYTPFKPYFTMARYDRDRFGDAIAQLPEEGRGPAMVQAGLSQLRNIVSGLSGRTAVIVFTDGTFTVVRGPKTPLQIAREIARDHNVCFYFISSATGPAQRRLERAVADISPCSRVIPMHTFIDNPVYLSSVLFDLKVSSYEKIRRFRRVVGFSMNNIYFDFNRARLQAVFKQDLGKLGQFMKQNPKAYVEVSGFTCNIGPYEANMIVSRGRAKAVAGYLIDTLGISPDRVVTNWFGINNPAADNSTMKGRRLNRRVEIAVSGLE